MNANQFIILALKHVEGPQSVPLFWRKEEDFTIYPWAAGVFTKAEIDARPQIYNNGVDAIAIPLTNQGMDSIGFRCLIDPKKVRGLLKEGGEKP